MLATISFISVKAVSVTHYQHAQPHPQPFVHQYPQPAYNSQPHPQPVFYQHPQQFVTPQPHLQSIIQQKSGIHPHSQPVKYIEPAHAPLVRYGHPTHIPLAKQYAPLASAPIVKHFTSATPVPIVKQFSASPVKYVAPQLVRYEPHAAKYPSATPVPFIQPVHSSPHHVGPQLVRYSPHPQYSPNPRYSPHGDKYVEPHPRYVKTDVYDAPAQYEFAYDVHDQLSGDVKSHAEKRNGDSVVGSYTVIDPDGKHSRMTAKFMHN